jgi:hypothetical protein
MTINADASVTADFAVEPDFTPVFSVMNLTQERKAALLLRLQRRGSFTGAISLTCAISGPSPMPTCNISSSVTAGKSATLTVNASALAVVLASPQSGPTGQPYTTWLPLGIIGSLVASGLFTKRRKFWALCILVLAVSTLSAACGGGGSNSPPPAQNYTVTASSGALVHTTTVGLTVE